MKKLLNSPAVEPLWYDAVYGEQAARQRYGRKHKTELPTRRDTLWYGDGTKLNLYYRDEQGKVRTTQVYEVIDAMSEVFWATALATRKTMKHSTTLTAWRYSGAATSPGR